MLLIHISSYENIVYDVPKKDAKVIINVRALVMSNHIWLDYLSERQTRAGLLNFKIHLWKKYC